MLTTPLQTLTWQSPEGPKKLAYRQWGQSNNPHVLLCVHGLTRNSNDFNTLALALQDRVQVIAPDMPGRGQSEWLQNASHYAIPVYVAACLALIAHLKPSTLDWLGTSMGGLIGMGYASLPNTQAPCPIRKLVLNDIGPTLNFEAMQRIAQYVGAKPKFAQLEQARQAIRTNCQTFGEHTEAQWHTLCDTVLTEEHGQWTTHHDPLIGEAFKQIAHDTLEAYEQTLWDVYDHIQAETLIIRGEQSDLLTVQTVKEMQNRGPKPKCITIPQVGHAPTFMNHEQIQVIKDFLF